MGAPTVAPIVMEAHFATVFEAIADTIGDEPAIVQGARCTSWSDFDDRAARIAQALLAAGVGRGDTVGLLLFNGSEYLESYYAALKIRAIPFNINYRYTAAEVCHVLEDAGASALVFHSSLTSVVADATDRRREQLRLLIEVDDGGGSLPASTSMDSIVATTDPAPRIRRDPGDVTILYTGGTTGMPKGVRSPIGPHVEHLIRSVPQSVGGSPLTVPSEVARFASQLRSRARAVRTLVAPPLIHGTALNIGALPALVVGGTIDLLSGASFDPNEVWAVVERTSPLTLSIVGDPFARPLLAALRSGSVGDVSALRYITSSGAMFSASVKASLLDRLDPSVVVLDYIAASEGSMGVAVATRADPGVTGRFLPNPGVVVIQDDLTPVPPGSGRSGLIAVPAVAEGYHGDDARTSSTFLLVGDRRMVVPGDHATVEVDGSLRLLGRGSTCINTGGEKVFPEEVEEVLKTVPGVDDAIVVGVADGRLGERVGAVIAADPGMSLDLDLVRSRVRSVLAGYKVPRLFSVVARVPRTVVGKPDLAATRALLTESPAFDRDGPPRGPT